MSLRPLPPLAGDYHSEPRLPAQSPLATRHLQLLDELRSCAGRLSLNAQDGFFPAPPLPEDAACLLTICGRWRRMDPCAASKLPNASARGDADLLLACEHLLEKRGAEFAESAAFLQCARQWWQQAELLRHCSETDEPSSSVSRSATAARLLWELDDMELILAALIRCGASDATRLRLMGQVVKCEQWIASHADDFAVAAEFVRGTLAMMRRDLPIADPLLAKTAVKYLQILTAAERMEQAVLPESLLPLEISLGMRHA